MRLGLGTVQFGQNYGIANKEGMLSDDAGREVLRYAESVGIDTLDTAISYGTSEVTLGRIGVSKFKVVSKVPDTHGLTQDPLSVFIANEANRSLSRLGVSKLYGLLLHRPERLLGDDGDRIWAALLSLKNSGVVEKIGYSIYSPTELDFLFDRYPADLIQCPLNIFDRRLDSSGWMEQLFRSGVEVHVRSVFLQGLLLMHSEARPKKFARWSKLWALWDAWLTGSGVSRLEACLSFALADSRVSRVILGVDNQSQLREIVNASRANLIDVPKELSCDDEDLINPALWAKL